MLPGASYALRVTPPSASVVDELVLLVAAELQHAALRGRELRADRDLHLLQVRVVQVLGDVAGRIGDAPDQAGVGVERLRDVAVVVGQRDHVALAVVGVALVIGDELLGPLSTCGVATSTRRRALEGVGGLAAFGVGDLGAVAEDVVLELRGARQRRVGDGSIVAISRLLRSNTCVIVWPLASVIAMRLPTAS